MGMFDTIYLEVKCPKCGEESMMECQTKDLDCQLNEYFKGDFVQSKKLLTEITETKKLYCTAECKSSSCTKPIKMFNGLEADRGTYFHIYVILRGGTITGEYIKLGDA